ncbi:MAG: head GIN domain-containing protein [Niabella sp.]
MKYLFFLLLTTITISSCNIVNDKISGNGNIITKDFKVDDFKNIDVGNAIQIFLTQDSGYSVKVATDENLFEYLKIRVNGETLYADIENGYWLQSTGNIKLYISMAMAKNISLSGATTLTTENQFSQDEKLSLHLSGASDAVISVKAPVFYVDASGASKMTVEGETRDVIFDASGASTIDAQNLKSENANAEASGASSINLFASISLRADASGASTISYSGNPSVKEKASGASSVEKVE